MRSRCSELAMFESESEGVARLTAYLQQTKRQAEHSIDKMNQHIEELQEDLETSKLVSRQLEQERDYFRNLAEQLREENTKKWRLQERDDWKALLESVQEDRERLQDECNRLEDKIDMAKQLLSADDLRVLEESMDAGEQSGSTSSSGAAGANSSITRTPPRRDNRSGDQIRSNSRRAPTTDDEDLQGEQAELNRHRSVVAEPPSRPYSPPDYIWPLSLFFKKSATPSQVFYV